MKCTICLKRCTSKHICSGLYVYKILKRMFLDIYYIDSLFKDSLDVTNVIADNMRRLNYEYDLF